MDSEQRQDREKGNREEDGSRETADGAKNTDASCPSQLTVTLYSFGFKYGYPEADMVWDVRFLPNPYWVDELRSRTGLEPAIAAYVLENSVGSEFLGKLESMLEFLILQYRKRKRADLRLAIGCTGGKHRSVAVTEHLRRIIAGLPVELCVFHRDIYNE